MAITGKQSGWAYQVKKWQKGKKGAHLLPGSQAANGQNGELSLNSYRRQIM
jgi:hypothetical protein